MPKQADAKAAPKQAETKKDSGKKAKKEEFDLLLEDGSDGKRKRIIRRFLNLLVVGFFMKDDDGGKENGASKDKASKDSGKKKAPSSGKGASENGGTAANVLSQVKKVDIFSGPFLMLAFTAVIFAARFAEEGYSPDHRDENETNYYEVMGLTSDADTMEIRKAYKALAMSWHPDKNPNCEQCPEKFAKISEAYETLSNPENRKNYDNKKSKKKGSVNSMASVELTAEDFETRVLRSNEVWIVQVYDPNDATCQSFHPNWEDVSISHQHVAKFGRIDATKQKKALEMLPQRVVVMPLVYRFARGMAPETLLYTGGEEQGTGYLSRFIIDGYPKIPFMESKKELRSFWDKPTPRVLVLTPGAAPPRRGGKALEYLQVARLAHMWSEFIDFASTDASTAVDALGQEFLPQDSSSWILATRSAASKKVESVGLKDLPSHIQESVTVAVKERVPPVTVRNHQQLCSANSQGTMMRTFCLVMVDVAESGVPGVLADLNASKEAYTQEVQDLSSSGEDAEEPFHVQAVRLSTSGSRWPWGQKGVGPGFSSLWSKAKYAPSFVIELETQRIAPAKQLKDLYQQIAYEDLKFNELPEATPLVRALPDPDTTLRKEFSMLLSSPLCTLGLYLLVAAVAAVLPELAPVAGCGLVGGAFLLLLLCWPQAFRRCILPLWCTVAPSSFECQVNL